MSLAKAKRNSEKNIDIYHWENRSSFGIWELRYNSGYVLNSVLQMRLNKFQPLYSNVLFTGLPTQDETSETTVQNLYCLFHYIHGLLLNCFVLCQINKYAIKRLD